ncbi:CLAVATA3/ESR (CLE)-related protein 13 [Capsicum chinense]|nr:CLAVATA3/ESR (CLE)-related protein 13 [Capsicum chinense]
MAALIKNVTIIKSPFTIILSIALILLCFFHTWCNFISINNHSNNFRHHRANLDNRRELIASQFDFTPFMKRHHHRKHLSPPPESTEIDPIYGVEKRLVPTGPNPLHH